MHARCCYDPFPILWVIIKQSGSEPAMGASGTRSSMPIPISASLQLIIRILGRYISFYSCFFLQVCPNDEHFMALHAKAGSAVPLLYKRGDVKARDRIGHLLKLVLAFFILCQEGPQGARLRSCHNPVLLLRRKVDQGQTQYSGIGKVLQTQEENISVTVYFLKGGKAQPRSLFCINCFYGSVGRKM